jgi:hypothetical protein
VIDIFAHYILQVINANVLEEQRDLVLIHLGVFVVHVWLLRCMWQNAENK